MVYRYELHECLAHVDLTSSSRKVLSFTSTACCDLDGRSSEYNIMLKLGTTFIVYASPPLKAPLQGTAPDVHMIRMIERTVTGVGIPAQQFQTCRVLRVRVSKIKYDWRAGLPIEHRMLEQLWSPIPVTTLSWTPGKPSQIHQGIVENQPKLKEHGRRESGFTRGIRCPCSILAGINGIPVGGKNTGAPATQNACWRGAGWVTKVRRV